MEMWMYEDWRYRKLGRIKVAVAIGGSAILGAGASLFGSSEQAGAEKDATNQANQIEEQQYNQNRQDQAPYRQAGYTALNQITQDQANGTGFAKPFDQQSFMSDPGYQFELQQGNQAIQRSAAAQGGLLSGAAAKAIAGYTTNLANTTYGDAYNRYLNTSNQQYNQLAGVAGLGQSATQNTVNTGSNTANQVAQNTIAGSVGAANASASGYVGAANSLAGGAGNLSQMYMLNNLFKNGAGGGNLGSVGQTTNYEASA